MTMMKGVCESFVVVLLHESVSGIKNATRHFVIGRV